jgi:hypothetical protein
MFREYRAGIVSAALSLIAGCIAYNYFQYDAFVKVSGQLLTLFSILTGLLAQVMVFTGMIVTPSALNDTKINALEFALDEQQQEWRIQFFIYIIAIAACAIPELFGGDGPSFLQDSWIRQIYVGISITAVFIAIIRSLRIPTAIIRLQRLRFRTIRDEMKAAEDLRSVGHADVGSYPKFNAPAVHPGHGAVVDLPRLHG